MGKLNIENRNEGKFYKDGKKKPANWQYSFEAAKIEGKRNKISKSGFRTQKECFESGIKAQNEYNNSGQAFKPSDLSVADYLDYWIKNYCEVNLKLTTVSGYKKKIRLYLKPYFGQYYLRSVTPSIVQEFLNAKFNEGISRNTLTSLKGILSGSFNYAVTVAKFIPINPVLGTKLPLSNAKPKTATRKKARQACTPEQIEEIFKRFPEGHPAYIPLQIGYRAGLRLGECFGLMWSDIDFEHRFLTVSRQVQNEGNGWYFSAPKYNSFRSIRMDDTLTEILRKEYDKQQRAKKYYANDYIQLKVKNPMSDDLYKYTDGILNTTDGDAVEMVMSRDSGEYIQPRILQHVGRVIHGYTSTPLISDVWDFHSMRHTHTTMLLEAGVNPVIVQHRLGHKDVQTTLNIYAHITNKMNDEAMKLINKTL